MKLSAKAALSIFKITLFLTAGFGLDLVAEENTEKLQLLDGAAEKNLVSRSKTFWPWHRNNDCIPFWPFGHCDHQHEQLFPTPPPSFPPVVSTPPQLPSVTLPVPPLPSIPSLLVFADERLAVVYPIIQKFKNIITSDPLGITKTWVGSDICSYKGFFCDIPPNNASAIAVASIDFNGYGLSAPSLDGFIDQLPDLALFHANSNFFSGTLSSSIAKLPYLYELDLSNNKFTGPFPLAVVGMDSLVFLDIRFNLFSGSIPPAIFTQNLNVLFLNDNNFVSSLPESLGNTHILYLTLADNQITGSLPSDITKLLSALAEVLLTNNKLTGCLPYELGFLNQVTVFDISRNQLTGPLPFSLACMERVALLDLSENLLYGIIPDLLCQLPNLAKLSLSDNYFTQVGPFCRNLISKGILDVKNNCIPGLPFQRSVFECTAFFAVPKICPYMNTFTIVPCKPHFH